MKFASDSSFILRLFDLTSLPHESDAAQEFLGKDGKCISVSELARIEVINVLCRRPQSGAADEFAGDLVEGTKLRLELVDWSSVWPQAESLARRFAPRLRPGGHDLVLVAAAVTMGASWFLSFDHHSRQRPLAAAAGLKVWPPLSKDEKGLARHR